MCRGQKLAEILITLLKSLRVCSFYPKISPPFDPKIRNVPKPIKAPENIEFQSTKNRLSLKIFAPPLKDVYPLREGAKIFRLPPC